MTSPRTGLARAKPTVPILGNATMNATADDVNPRAIRAALGFSLQGMADFLGVSYHTYRSWEDENPATRKHMSGAARSLLRICAARPDVVRAVLKNVAPQAKAARRSQQLCQEAGSSERGMSS